MENINLVFNSGWEDIHVNEESGSLETCRWCLFGNLEDAEKRLEWTSKLM